MEQVIRAGIIGVFPKAHFNVQAVVFDEPTEILDVGNIKIDKTLSDRVDFIL